MNIYPIRKTRGFDASKSRIFAFQMSINSILNNESNMTVSIKQQNLRHPQECLQSLWSDKDVTNISNSGETNITESNNDNSVSTHKEFNGLRIKLNNNMDILMHHFNSTQDFPEYYFGKVEKVALCRCPQTGQESWNNGNNLITANPRKNMLIKVQIKIKDKIYERELIFVKWETENFYEWRLKSGNILQLHQKFIDGLRPKDKKYLRMHT